MRYSGGPALHRCAILGGRHYTNALFWGRWVAPQAKCPMLQEVKVNMEMFAERLNNGRKG